MVDSESQLPERPRASSLTFQSLSFLLCRNEADSGKWPLLRLEAGSPPAPSLTSFLQPGTPSPSWIAFHPAPRKPCLTVHSLTGPVIPSQGLKSYSGPTLHWRQEAGHVDEPLTQSPGAHRLI